MIVPNTWNVLYRVQFSGDNAYLNDDFDSREEALAYAKEHLDAEPVVNGIEVYIDENGIAVDEGEVEELFNYAKELEESKEDLPEESELDKRLAALLAGDVEDEEESDAAAEISEVSDTEDEESDVEEFEDEISEISDDEEKEDEEEFVYEPGELEQDFGDDTVIEDETDYNFSPVDFLSELAAALGIADQVEISSAGDDIPEVEKVEVVTDDDSAFAEIPEVSEETSEPIRFTFDSDFFSDIAPEEDMAVATADDPIATEAPVEDVAMEDQCDSCEKKCEKCEDQLEEGKKYNFKVMARIFTKKHEMDDFNQDEHAYASVEDAKADFENFKKDVDDGKLWEIALVDKKGNRLDYYDYYVSNGMTEEFCGNPEIRTTHLEYTDKDVTDSEFNFPDNISKKVPVHQCTVAKVSTHDDETWKELDETVESVDNWKAMSKPKARDAKDLINVPFDQMTDEEKQKAIDFIADEGALRNYILNDDGSFTVDDEQDEIEKDEVRKLFRLESLEDTVDRDLADVRVDAEAKESRVLEEPLNANDIRKFEAGIDEDEMSDLEFAKKFEELRKNK